MSLGLIVVGDFALATGEDRHVKYVATLLGKTARSLSWAWLIPASRVAIASALFEAFQRPHPVACFGGLGAGVDACCTGG
jgi:molybdopterin-biosynthesis enzyme MoeA-like protein